MRKILLLLVLLVVACTSPYNPNVDVPHQVITQEDRHIIDYIDQRLMSEYYWLDEVEQKEHLFNRNTTWTSYLSASLSQLTTNTDDGYISNNGSRAYYSYIRKVASTTRAATMGYGIALYYTIVKIGDSGYGFLIDNVYPDSPAAEADVRRGDIITRINGSDINSNNYNTLFTSIQNNTASSLRLEVHRQVDDDGRASNYAVALERASYEPTPVAYYDVITIEGSSQRIGYLVYTSFDSDYDEQLVSALESMSAEGVDSFILDLRCNRGGNVSSALKLCSVLMGADYAGATLCTLKRNPRNVKMEESTVCALEDVGLSLNLAELTVICSGNTASASELVVTGLRGLDVPVTLIGSTTEGKNCGMDVTRRTIDNTTVEYAPITFMCLDAKGFGDWGEGIIPNVDLTVENAMGVSDELYPMPRCRWGELSHDIALAAAVASVTGRSIGTAPRTRFSVEGELTPAYEVEAPFEGIRYYGEP